MGGQTADVLAFAAVEGTSSQVQGSPVVKYSFADLCNILTDFAGTSRHHQAEAVRAQDARLAVLMEILCAAWGAGGDANLDDDGEDDDPCFEKGESDDEQGPILPAEDPYKNPMECETSAATSAIEDSASTDHVNANKGNICGKVVEATPPALFSCQSSTSDPSSEPDQLKKLAERALQIRNIG